MAVKKLEITQELIDHVRSRVPAKFYNSLAKKIGVLCDYAESSSDGWINAQDALPKNKQARCIVIMPRRRTQIRTWAEVFGSGRFGWVDDFGHPSNPELFESQKVLFWREMPKLPKGL